MKEILGYLFIIFSTLVVSNLITGGIHKWQKK